MSKLTRKEFLKRTLVASAGVPFVSRLPEMERASLNVPELPHLYADEVFWVEVRQQFRLDPKVLNLNNGAVGPQPFSVQQAHIKMYEQSNTAPSHFMWKDVDGKREAVRHKLANLIDCQAEEVAINRNTTEGLNTLVFGLDLQKGDEVVVSDYDYPFLLNAWKQRALRDGIVIKKVNLSLPMEDNHQIVELYRLAITPKTKVVHVTHLINWTGQIMPVMEISRMAKKAGCLVVVDAAHSLAHIPFSFKEIGCDYLATSLHKWLGAPFGTGALVIKKEQIPTIWPAPSAWQPQSDNIRKFEVLGTRSFPAEMSAMQAVSFHQEIGTERVNERLNYLKMYWVNRVKGSEKVRFHTSLKPTYSGAMATFSIDGIEAEKIADFLFDTDGIHVGIIKWNGLNGVRISPHIYTSLEELDRLVNAIQKLTEG